MLPKLPFVTFLILLIGLFSVTGCRTTNASADGQIVASRGERECIKSGWEKISMNVVNSNRSLLYKAPAGVWPNGVIIIMHGGGGEASQFCAGGRLVQPQIHFADMAIARGFAVIVLDSTDNLVTDAKGRVCGKRFDFSVLNRPNIDLPFIAKVLDEIIPVRRPPGSSKGVFITGLSTGGYMTIRAATYFDDRITAFAPVSAGDPFGTDTICDTSLSRRKTAKGILVDRETHKEITNANACLSSSYPNESKLLSSNPPKKPVFKQFQHEADGIVDISCMKKARTILINRGYQDDGAFIIKSNGKKSVFKHLWLESYNKAILNFFARESARLH